jgi:hypothetical protein
MTIRLSMRPGDMVAHLGGGVIAVKAVRVERDFHPIAMAAAAARGWELRKSATIHHPIIINRLHQDPLIWRLAAVAWCRTIRTDCFYCAASRAPRLPTFPLVRALGSD